MQDEGGVGSASGKQVRAGSQALTILADPLTTWVLRAHAEGALRFRELEETLGWAARTTLRSVVGDLRRIGVLAKRDVRAMPYSVANELTDAGRDLALLAETLQRWLSHSPTGSIAADTTAAKGAVKALTAGWDCGAVRAMAEEPTSLTELSIAVDGFSYPALERRLAKMRTTGQIQAVGDRTKGTRYGATKWLCQAVAPLSAAVRWERLHLPESAPEMGPTDVEATFLLALPIVTPPRNVSGECSLVVITGADTVVGKGKGLAGVSLHATAGQIVSRPSEPGVAPSTWALGPADAWLEAIIDGDHRHLRLSGAKPRLPQAVVSAMHSSLFAGG